MSVRDDNVFSVPLSSIGITTGTHTDTIVSNRCTDPIAVAFCTNIHTGVGLLRLLLLLLIRACVAKVAHQYSCCWFGWYLRVCDTSILRYIYMRHATYTKSADRFAWLSISRAHEHESHHHITNHIHDKHDDMRMRSRNVLSARLAFPFNLVALEPPRRSHRNRHTDHDEHEIQPKPLTTEAARSHGRQQRE